MKIIFLIYFFLLIFLKTTAQNTQDTIHWRLDYKLKWGDFQGVPDKEHWVAGTACSFSYSYKYYDSRIFFETCSYFFKKLSEVDTFRISKYSLIHEQGHFDICEYYSRILLFRLRESNLTKFNVKDNSNIILNEVSVEYNKVDELYDLETLHGTDFTKQEEWDEKITQWLRTSIK
jgi:hypothetical protein